MSDKPGLKFIKIEDMSLIPKYLLEQVKGADWQADDIYRFWPMFNNPFNVLYALSDKDYMVKGVLWLTVNPLQRSLFVQILSVDKEYQGQNIINNQVVPFLQNIVDKLQLKNYKMLVTRPKVWERLGFKRNRLVLMEG